MPILQRYVSAEHADARHLASTTSPTSDEWSQGICRSRVAAYRIGAHAFHERADLQARRGDVLEQRRRERAVAALAVERDVVGLRRVGPDSAAAVPVAVVGAEYEDDFINIRPDTGVVVQLDLGQIAVS